ncbi:hypothetical protein ABW20_dc0101312 [Dactylellina cionopaga]|nr:hypothetical protein ABW20_dc0101312 [Dactylellina cionopaga]
MSLFVDYGSVTGQGMFVTKVLSAADGHFWVGKNTSSSCPADKKDCPAGDSTAIRVWADSTNVTMSVEVPGGQQFYIGPDRAFSYTRPQSPDIPEGSIYNGFSVNHGGMGGFYFNRAAEGASLSWYACPDGSSDEKAPWQLFGTPDTEDIPGHDRKACKNILLACSPSGGGASAWQYN